MIQTEGIFVGGGAISAPIIGKDFNWTGGDGTYQVIDDDGGDWRIKFPYSGTFTPLKNMVMVIIIITYFFRIRPLRDRTKPPMVHRMVEKAPPIAQ